MASLLLLLAGCSSAPNGDVDINIDAWSPPSTGLTAIDCSELLPEWGTGEEEAPDRCWTFEETTGLPDRFEELTNDLSDHAGSQPVRGPSCAAKTACAAEWEGADEVVTLGSSITLGGLQAEINAGVDVGPDTPRLYELTIWTADEPRMTDAEWESYYDRFN